MADLCDLSWTDDGQAAAEGDVTPERLATITNDHAKTHEPWQGIIPSIPLGDPRCQLCDLLDEIDRLAGEVARWHRHNEEVVKMERAAVERAEEAERQRDALRAVVLEGITRHAAQEPRIVEMVERHADAYIHSLRRVMDETDPTWRDAPPRVADGEGRA